MEYPNLLLAMRTAGRPQYQVARAAGIREGRLSTIVRHGGATPAERRALSRVLGIGATQLFGRRPVAISTRDAKPTERAS